MDYAAKWKVLADLLKELQARGEKIPAHIINDLRAAKVMIQVLEADSAHTENVSRVDTYLNNVEAYAILTLERCGTETIVEWLNRIKDTKTAKKKEQKREVSKFAAGVPRDKKWMRIQVSENTPIEEVKRLAGEAGLTCKLQKNGYMLVHGNEKDIKNLVKQLAERCRSTRKA